MAKLTCTVGLIVEPGNLFLQAVDHLPIAGQHEPERPSVIHEVMVEREHNLYLQAREADVLADVWTFKLIHGKEKRVVCA